MLSGYYVNANRIVNMTLAPMIFIFHVSVSLSIHPLSYLLACLLCNILSIVGSGSNTRMNNLVCVRIGACTYT